VAVRSADLPICRSADLPWAFSRNATAVSSKNMGASNKEKPTTFRFSGGAAAPSAATGR
jgi:hypothetical protein